jgi:hypothetical protein
MGWILMQAALPMRGLFRDGGDAGVEAGYE